MVPLIPVRYIFTALAFIGFVFNYTLRINMNLVITSMVNQTALNISQGKPVHPENAKNDGPFVWDSVVTGDVVGMFFAGYMVFQMPGGRMAEVYGGKRVLAAAMGGVSALTLLIPVTANAGGKDGYPYLLIIVRVLMGLCEAATFPCITSMLARWAPESERATMTTIIMSGSQAGTIVGFFISGVLSDWVGWEAVFYIEGSACFIWLALWLWLASDTPQTHPSISEAERDYILAGLPATNAEPLPIPWKSIWTSLPFWAIMMSNFGNNWGFHLLMTELPQYLSKNFADMKTSTSVGIWTAIPYGSMWITANIFGIISDLLIRKNILSTGVSRKIFNTISHLGPALCLLGIVLGVTNENKEETLTLVLFTIAVACMGALYSGFITNPQDIAPNFAGTLLGLTNCIGSIPGFVAPSVASAIVVDDDTDVTKWRTVWIITIVILICEVIQFFLFAKGEPQSWNNQERASKQGKDWFLVVFTVGIALIGAVYVGIMMGLNGY